jgi:acetyltransferase EpsM
MSVRVVILGGPGVGTMVAEAVHDLAAAGHAIAIGGFLNDRLPVGSFIGEARILGRFSDWRQCDPDARYIAAIPKPKEAAARYRLIRSLRIPSARWATIVHPQARIARGVPVGSGTYIGPHAVVEPGASIGSHCCIRAGAYVSHDTRLGDFCFLGPNATLLGNVSVGEGAHIGPNAACREELSIGDYAVVGLAAAVVDHVAAGAIVAGSPARMIGAVPR